MKMGSPGSQACSSQNKYIVSKYGFWKWVHPVGEPVPSPTTFDFQNWESRKWPVSEPNTANISKNWILEMGSPGRGACSSQNNLVFQRVPRVPREIGDRS